MLGLTMAINRKFNIGSTIIRADRNCLNLVVFFPKNKFAGVKLKLKDVDVKIDLFSEPFNFKKNYLLSIEDKDESYVVNHKFLYLFSRKQINEFIKIKTSGHK